MNLHDLRMSLEGGFLEDYHPFLLPPWALRATSTIGWDRSGMWARLNKHQLEAATRLPRRRHTEHVSLLSQTRRTLADTRVSIGRPSS
jgi:hypothetical protein